MPFSLVGIQDHGRTALASVSNVLLVTAPNLIANADRAATSLRCSRRRNLATVDRVVKDEQAVRPRLPVYLIRLWRDFWFCQRVSAWQPE